MPFHLPPLSRRAFLKTSLAAGAGLLTIGEARGDEFKRWALIADTHIAADREAVSRGIKMAEHLKRVTAQITRMSDRPAGVLLNGDCALTDGRPGDYATLTDLVTPIRNAGIPLHMTLGNHDHRENFWTAVKYAASKPLHSKHVSVIETPLVNWFLLDSLDRTNVTPGRLGEEQLEWLKAALDARPRKPALVFGHHHPNFATSVPVGGLLDSQELFAALAPRTQVKGYIFGHTHHWELAEREGIHLINLPPVAYVFKAEDPSGWVEAAIESKGMTLSLRSLDPAHPAHAKSHHLRWRE